MSIYIDESLDKLSESIKNLREKSDDALTALQRYNDNNLDLSKIAELLDPALFEIQRAYKRMLLVHIELCEKGNYVSDIIHWQ